MFRRCNAQQKAESGRWKVESKQWKAEGRRRKAEGRQPLGFLLSPLNSPHPAFRTEHCAFRTEHSASSIQHSAFRCSGMTLLELLIAMSIMVIVAGMLGALAKGVEEGFQYAEGHGLATQHARVVLDRIAAKVREAAANEQFPGVIVLAEMVDSYRFPDTVVVWHPSGAPADPDGLPRYNELVIYCPDRSEPNRLVEITAPSDARTVPPVENQAQWAAEIAAIKTSGASRVVTLTRLMRTASTDGSSSASLRGAVRFETRLRPSPAEWNAYKSGSRPWEQLAWVQGIYGSQTGLRQVWLRTELQLMPDDRAAAGETAGSPPSPFLGSAALYYRMRK
jgi:prepilin-type N-terminal cleavage/methylation domain-containing protein